LLVPRYMFSANIQRRNMCIVFAFQIIFPDTPSQTEWGEDPPSVKLTLSVAGEAAKQIRCPLYSISHRQHEASGWGFVKHESRYQTHRRGWNYSVVLSNPQGEERQVDKHLYQTTGARNYYPSLTNAARWSFIFSISESTRRPISLESWTLIMVGIDSICQGSPRNGLLAGRFHSVL